MITPVFRLTQDANFVTVLIKAPHIRTSEIDFYISDTEFKFYAKPYFLRLRFESEIVEDGTETCKYDIDEGLITTQLPKKHKGEYFEGLDLLTTLLAKKPTPQGSSAGPNIEVLDSHEDASEEPDDVEDEEFDWEVDQVLPDSDPIGLINGHPYGFDDKYKGTLNKILSEIPDAVEVNDPDNSAMSARHAQRVAAENERFSIEHYAADYDGDDDGILRELQAYQPKWKEWRNETTQVIAFSDVENEAMSRLPRKEIVVSSTKAELLGLVDIIFAWAYDHRTTMGDHTVESAWTITTLSATLTFLVRHENVRAALTTAVHRALAYPLHRNWALIQQVLDDTKLIFAWGKRAILKCLLDCRDILIHDEVRHCLADLYLTDYCVWIQSVPEKAFDALATRVQSIEVAKADVRWPLERIEAIVDNDDDDATDSDDASEDETDSDDNIGSEESNNEPDVAGVPTAATGDSIEAQHSVASITASMTSLSTNDRGWEAMHQPPPTQHAVGHAPLAPHAVDDDTNDDADREARRFIEASHQALTAQWGSCVCCPLPSADRDATSGASGVPTSCQQNAPMATSGTESEMRERLSPVSNRVGIEVLSSTEFCPPGTGLAADDAADVATGADCTAPRTDGVA
eukprot:m.159924 g.159924  ORF g.159924 m.159924 type:complete len:631 (+) comp18008_c0_seq1:246-2138(+)